MRDWRLIFGKTAEGEREAQQRDRVLLPSLRRALILCDGRKTLGELSGLVRAGEIDLLIQFLETAGLIEEVGMASHLPRDSATCGDWHLDGRAVPYIVKRLISQMGHDPELIDAPTWGLLKQSETPLAIREHLRRRIDHVRVSQGINAADRLLAATRYALVPDANWPTSTPDPKNL